MALPTLNAPEHTLELPSTGDKVKYRPFLVKEQKILMLAQEGDSEEESVEAIKQIINNCCSLDEKAIENLPLFDIEYIFLQLRSKSVGESVTLYFRHQECENNDNQPSTKQTEINVDLSKVKVTKDPKHTTKIQLTKDVGVIMKYPKIDLINKYQETGLNADTIFELIGNCIDKVYDSENSYNNSDYTPEEMENFISSMTETQFQDIRNFFDTMPVLKHTVKFTCVDCGFKDNIELEGIQSFFI